MQPYFFPYIGYFQLINAVNKFVIYDDVKFIKGGWINRNNLLVNGEKNLFSVPVKKPSQTRLIKDALLDNSTQWQSKLLKTIELNYKKAPFFADVYPILEKIILPKRELLIDLVSESIEMICEYLNINTELIVSSKTYNNIKLNKEHRLIDICKKEHANIYINPIGGTDLYTKDTFQKDKIILSFLKTNSIIYPQLSNDFIPYLSIIDVLIFNSKSTVQNYLNEYTLV